MDTLRLLITTLATEHYRRFLSYVLLFSMSGLILYHLIAILVWGKVLIYENSVVILSIEIALLSGIVLLSIERLANILRRSSL